MTDFLDRIQDFALPERKQLPCDTPSLTARSADAFDQNHDKLSTTEKIAAARHITKRAADHGIKLHGRDVSFYSGTDLSPTFKTALASRRYASGYDADVMKNVDLFSKMAERIAQEEDQQVRTALLDKLASDIDALDSKWRREFLRGKVPDAASTVFGRETVDDDVVKIGSETIKPSDFARLNKEAAQKALHSSCKAINSWEEFRAADSVEQAAIAAFIPAE